MAKNQTKKRRINTAQILSGMRDEENQTTVPDSTNDNKDVKKDSSETYNASENNLKGKEKNTLIDKEKRKNKPSLLDKLFNVSDGNGVNERINFTIDNEILAKFHEITVLYGLKTGNSKLNKYDLPRKVLIDFINSNYEKLKKDL
ncbi:hypothetical protein FHS04_002785 [Mesoflavibacter sabulilitoris]|uniref:DUF3408 domain-containing protein n=1 Tax=Mesoflavibacter zeaxanthinifaciens subsp. sabulilitoris TaxID=1520893 RepID=A0A2T1NNL9_9FLAO|nr:hypothetical protein [Mesoflavibacter zeaxanthinifaciens]MBB3125241.1 hypothetical protein [Mesoflavibacter zeaxanthinifaciens subsp. sabulilitoris]PSG94476.1 hypothetical protein C7H61_00655 [Mesoflavibacter zeaxanthinifaciens subsp. sabulilitoris]